MSDAPAIKAPRPGRVVVDQEPDGLRLSYAWIGPKYLLLALFCVVWDGFLVFWYRNALQHPDPTGMAFWFPIGHVAVGVGLTYSTLAGLFNRTTIRVSPGAISIRHGPVPWWGNRVVQAADVRQLYREQITSRSGEGVTVRYQLSAVLHQGPKLKLLASDQADVALFIEQEVERHLGIADVKVSGEMPK